MRATGLPLDERGRIRCEAALRVVDHPEVFAGGDCAAVPDLAAAEPDATCPPSAQHAVRQGKRMGANILASVRGEALNTATRGRSPAWAYTGAWPRSTASR
ncbi:FAD-dependent oxidoreductase [Actinokineospora sp. G85]|uniref:FAD-dependent oxidoreductase n=1 Tax=Actinokineospora sp. G85 TaxID=3406626 RepID=UPI003C70B8BC